MQGKILIVDAISTNRIVLKVKLASAFYEIMQASSGEEAFALATWHDPDLVICAMELPDCDAADLCARLHANSRTSAVPMMVIGTRPNSAARLRALSAGVLDVMHKPLDDTLLLARVRSLIRAHNTAAEWQLRDDTSRALGFAEEMADFGPPGETVIVSTEQDSAREWIGELQPLLRSTIALTAPDRALRDLNPEKVPDVFVLALSSSEHHSGDVLRLLAAIRATNSTRHAGILVLQTRIDAGLGAYALDLGADDLMTDGFDAAELALRVKAMMRRKRIADQLRATVRTGLQAAVSDPLTGLRNRRYAMPHLARVAEHARATGRSFAVMLADLDHFKQINDLYGHASGDAVLVETARRLCADLRPADLVARIGGEEFLIVMPSTTIAEARTAAGRLCQTIGADPFRVPATRDPIKVTVSIGLAIGGRADGAGLRGENGAEAILAAADKALYEAKSQGRNQVTLSRPAA
ncbi:diguanylate cyclase [Sulfitobacter sp. D35]|uniref:diguanylate cyclase n=1 Tax=Sulfitobacter sp. D35 TaxID=3083252 RepID=UPI00296E3FE5|nr:diguanylate cyclase [Sulfitobacter sp. D35]MDW4496617.1 diguanylate cyclase [Sulfitobacter sp. D35]